MSKVAISVIPCPMADGSTLPSRGWSKFAVWVNNYGDFGRMPNGRRKIGSGVTFTETFDEAIEAANEYARTHQNGA